MFELQIDAELKALIPPLTPEEYAQLEQNILAEGCRDPLVLWRDYLLDGHNRYDICRKHGIPFQTVQKEGLKTKNDARVWMAMNQLGRRNISDFARVELMLIVKPALAEKAKQNSEANLKRGDSPDAQNFAPFGKSTNEIVAGLAGVSRETVRKVEKVKEGAAPEVIEKARSGEISIHAAARTVEPSKVKSAAPIEPVAGKPTAAVPPQFHPDADPLDDATDVIQALQEEIAQLQAQVQTLQAAANPDVLKKLQELQAYIKVVESQRNEWQNKCNELTKEVKKLKRQLEKASA